MAIDDDDPFASAMREVAPISSNKHRQSTQQPPKARDVIKQRREASPQTAPINNSASRHAPASQPEPWSLRANGVSSVVVRRLAAGQPPIATTLDLHGMHREPSLEQLRKAIHTASQQGQRVLRVIHGRGMHSSNRPVLKQAVYHDLQHGPCAHHVLAAILEPNSAGGACLVLLRRDRS
ncbi:MAG: Smr/MutS family protein [Mariprofundaceae bacterium]|nr:Smr/MutS family protein [Mariprofundaceae bacterium]